MLDNIYNDDGRQYLQMLQGTIERMANNSSNCKTWMVTIVAAFLALQCTITDLNGWIILGLLPVGLFWYMDSMYLKLERGFRNRQRDFINKINTNPVQEKNVVPVYDFSVLLIDEDDNVNGFKTTKGVWRSKSILWFYSIPSVVIVILSVCLNWNIINGLFNNAG